MMDMKAWRMGYDFDDSGLEAGASCRKFPRKLLTLRAHQGCWRLFPEGLAVSCGLDGWVDPAAFLDVNSLTPDTFLTHFCGISLVPTPSVKTSSWSLMPWYPSCTVSHC